MAFASDPYYSLNLPLLTLIALTFLCYHVMSVWVRFKRASDAVNNHPGPRTILSPGSNVSQVLPITIPYVSLGRNSAWVDKHDEFRKAGSDVLVHVSAWPKPDTVFNLADPFILKEITTSRAKFPKPLERYDSLLVFGDNIVASEGELWKRFRRICAPAFSERNNRLVWNEAIRITQEMFTVRWNDSNRVVEDNCTDIALSMTLSVIAAAGFGNLIGWEEDSVVPEGFQMSFKSALHISLTNVIFRIALPSWIFKTTKKLKIAKAAFDDLDKYMKNMVRDRRSLQEKEERYDLFSGLVDAQGDDIGDGDQLHESEIVGNTFIFLLAGHETSAHTLSFAFGLLALYPDEQETLYEHIKSVLPDGRAPQYEDMPKLTRSLAVLYETLRMFPPTAEMLKFSVEDTVFSTTNSLGEKQVIPVPKGSQIVLNTDALHYNSNYWDDPHAFKPKRFLKDWPRDAFMPFSAGARACIGRKFAETESIAIITLLVSKYKMSIKEEPEFMGETAEARRARVLHARPVLTLAPTRIPIVFERR